jgi:predicted nucleotidyltransferase
MRISENEKKAILKAVHALDPDAHVILFGSRANDNARGGDIDLLVISDHIGFREEMKIRPAIMDQIGWQKIDLIVHKRDQATRPIVAIALETGVPL